MFVVCVLLIITARIRKFIYYNQSLEISLKLTVASFFGAGVVVFIINIIIKLYN